MTMLKVSNLTKDYGAGLGVFDFNLSMKEKDIVLLLGPNGAGKTTAMRGIVGLTNVDANIVFNDMNTQEDPRSFLKDLGACVSAPAYYEYMTGFENLSLYQKFYPHVDDARVIEVLDIVELTRAKDKKVAEYSTGMKQRLDFARAILHSPKLLILDEPFNGMDIEKKAELKNHLRKLAQENNTSILISSHMVGDLERFANRVVILYEGQCLYDGSVSQVLAEHENLEEFYLETIHLFKKAKTVS